MLPAWTKPLPDWQTIFPNYYPCWDYTRIQVNQAEKQVQAVYPDKSLTFYFADVAILNQFTNQDKNLLLTNAWYTPEVAKKLYYEQFADSYYGVYYNPAGIIDITPTKGFNCLIGRVDPIRQSWLYLLMRRNIFDQGLVSFNLDTSRIREYYPNNITDLEIFEDLFTQHLSIFHEEHKIIQNQIPYKNFDEKVGLNNVIMQTKFSIILETYCVSPEYITFTEKTFRCLRLPRPWILHATRNSVQYLRDLGFDVLDDIVDHSYDSIEFEIDRQSAILDQAQELLKLDFTEAVLYRCKQATIHNQALLLKFHNDFRNDVNTTVAQAIDKCLS